MSGIAVSSDGEYIFLALEEPVSGNQVVVKAARADLSAWFNAYAPAGGSAGNVAATGDPDVIMFFGNFGSGIQVVKHTISTVTNDNISPTGLTTKVANCLAVNPSNVDEVAITVDTDQVVKYTPDGGTNWGDWAITLGFDPTALYTLWSGQYEAHRFFVAGNTGAAVELLYSPNEGVTSDDLASVALAAVANVVGIEVAEV